REHRHPCLRRNTPSGCQSSFPLLACLILLGSLRPVLSLKLNRSGRVPPLPSTPQPRRPLCERAARCGRARRQTQSVHIATRDRSFLSARVSGRMLQAAGSIHPCRSLVLHPRGPPPLPLPIRRSTRPAPVPAPPDSAPAQTPNSRWNFPLRIRRSLF